MGFVEAIQSGFNKYVGFTGRAARSEFWYWALFVFIVNLIAKFIDSAMGADMTHVGLVGGIVGLALFLPGLAMTIRRLHDRDKSGWWVLLVLIPLIGAIILLIWFIMRGTQGPNRFGEDPVRG